MKGNLIIISSPSGGGKGTLIKEVLNTIPDLTCSVSYTTRPIRPGEQDGREYFFISRDDFEHRRNEGEFLEHATVHGNLYGTSRSQLAQITESGRAVILEIDVQGANQILEKVGDVVSIFITPISPIAFTLMYYNIRFTTEGLNELLNTNVTPAQRPINFVSPVSRFQFDRHDWRNIAILSVIGLIVGIVGNNLIQQLIQQLAPGLR